MCRMTKLQEIFFGKIVDRLDKELNLYHKVF